VPVYEVTVAFEASCAVTVTLKGVPAVGVVVEGVTRKCVTAAAALTVWLSDVLLVEKAVEPLPAPL
jgi:hypothetical protein